MTCEQLKKIAWLNRAFHAERNAQAWFAKQTYDRNLAQRLSRSVSSSGFSSYGNGTEHALIRLAETERQTQEKLAELVRIREEITSEIEKIPDSDLQTILVWRYLKYLTFEKIAEKMNYSVRNIHYKHKAALDKLCTILH
ncbi:MAG: DUF1492 domain-containing protein [Oscillospiraceae bacterium]|nr:DUF1492 domain-containing protein [Oscillospiraceae bacterium]